MERQSKQVDKTKRNCVDNQRYEKMCGDENVSVGYKMFALSSG